MNNWLQRICNLLGIDFKRIANPLELAAPFELTASLELLCYSARAGRPIDRLRDRSIFH